MINIFDTLEYLKKGSARQKAVYTTLTAHSVFDRLSDFTPYLAGTFPLGIDVRSSDIDIICYWTNKEDFKSEIEKYFSHLPEFQISEKWVNGCLTVIATFSLDNFLIEVFGQNRPIKEQEAYKHLMIEYFLLQKHGNEFKMKIIKLKNQGVKTEPAFAQLLRLKGDPYQALLEIEIG